MGGIKRDADTYVEIIPPKVPKPEQPKRVLPEDVTLDEAAFGKKPERWRPPEEKK